MHCRQAADEEEEEDIFASHSPHNVLLESTESCFTDSTDTDQPSSNQPGFSIVKNFYKTASLQQSSVEPSCSRGRGLNRNAYSITPKGRREYAPCGLRTRGGLNMHAQAGGKRPPGRPPRAQSTPAPASVPVPIQVPSEATNWKSRPAKVTNFAFIEIPGLKIDMGANPTAMDFMNLFLTDDFISQHVSETNRHADEIRQRSRPFRRKARSNAWTPTNDVEMRKFFGLIFHMGIFKLPSIAWYWKKHPSYKTDFFRSVMSRDRFQLLLRFWYFGEQGEGRDAKVKKIVDHLNETMKQIYTPERQLSIDESMMLWRGRLIFRQYIKNKKHKYGVKFFELCQYDGLVVRASIYIGIAYEDPGQLGQSGAVIMHLMSDYLEKGYQIYCDNYYNGIPLTKALTAKSTNICGTLRKSRKYLPKNVMKAKLKKGEYTWQSLDSTVVCKWKDKREVLTISNLHPTVELIGVKNRRGNIKMKPNTVKDYNADMSGIDRADQMLSYHSALRKTLRW